MPVAAPKPCTYARCGVLVRDGSSRCDAHKVQAWTRSHDKPRMTGRRLQQARRALFQRQPLCEPCLVRGHTTEATIRDHRIPLAEGGADDESNEQAICAPCHREKTLAEALRGRRA
jgi:5-methylcytosine-specific restriction protein A